MPDEKPTLLPHHDEGDFLQSLADLSDPGDAHFDGERIRAIRDRAKAILANRRPLPAPDRGETLDDWEVDADNNIGEIYIREKSGAKGRVCRLFPERTKAKEWAEFIASAPRVIRELRARPSPTPPSALPGEVEDALKATRAALKDDAADLWRIYNGIRDIIKRKSWVTEGRGAYEWNDDRYRAETYEAFREVRELLESVQPGASKRYLEVMRQGDAALASHLRSVPAPGDMDEAWKVMEVFRKMRHNHGEPPHGSVSWAFAVLYDAIRSVPVRQEGEVAAWMHPTLGDTISPKDKRPDFEFVANGRRIPTEQFTVALVRRAPHGDGEKP